MSVLCAVQFADPERTVTRMTVFDYNPDTLNIGRMLSVAVAAYESRMKRPPPLIKEPERIAGFPDILQYQWQAADGKISTTTAAQYRRDLLFMSMFTGLPAGDGAQQQKPRRPRIRSMAEWRELQRRRALGRLARADADLRRELLATFERCPCCGQPLDPSKPPPADDDLMLGWQSGGKRIRKPRISGVK